MLCTKHNDNCNQRRIKWKNKLWIWIFKRNSEISQEKDLSICCVSVDETLHPNFTVIKITQNEMDAAAVIGMRAGQSTVDAGKLGCSFKSIVLMPQGCFKS